LAMTYKAHLCHAGGCVAGPRPPTSWRQA
jgi:hypothetical protein